MSALTVERAMPSGCRARPIGRVGRATRPTRPRAPIGLARLSDRSQCSGTEPARCTPSTARGVRLTRRGRLVLICLLAAALVALTVSWGAARTGAAATDTPRHTVTVIVGSGDSLWSIAGDVDPHANRQRLIDRIIAVNGLDGARIEPGQRLTVPVTDPG